MMAPRGAGGFSLLELIVVLLIIAVTGAFTLPAVASGWRAREVRQSTRELAGVMRGLRERAIRLGTEQELLLDPDGRTVEWSGEAGTTLPEGASIIGIRGGWRDTDGSVRVVFYPNGGTTGVALLVGDERPGGLRFAIEVDSLLGAVVIEDATT